MHSKLHFFVTNVISLVCEKIAPNNVNVVIDNFKKIVRGSSHLCF